jgi:ubiquilin
MMNPWGSAGTSGTGNPVPGQQQQPSPQQMEQTLQMLENPMVAQMMDQVLQNPEAVRQMMEANPMMAQLRAQNPGMAQAMENPEMLRTMMNPNNLRAMMQLQSAMQQLQQGGALPAGMMGSMPPPGGMMGASGTGGMGSMPPGTTTGTSAAPAAGGLDFSSLLNQMQSTNLSQSQPTPMRPPQERFRHQLQSLQDMGFEDEEENIRALQSNHGNLNRAVDQLIMGGGSSGGSGSSAPAPAAAPTTTSDAPAAPAPAAEPEPEQQPPEEPKDSADKKND